MRVAGAEDDAAHVWRRALAHAAHVVGESRRRTAPSSMTALLSAGSSRASTGLAAWRSSQAPARSRRRGDRHRARAGPLEAPPRQCRRAQRRGRRGRRLHLGDSTASRRRDLGRASRRAPRAPRCRAPGGSAPALATTSRRCDRAARSAGSRLAGLDAAAIAARASGCGERATRRARRRARASSNPTMSARLPSLPTTSPRDRRCGRTRERVARRLLPYAVVHARRSRSWARIPRRRRRRALDRRHPEGEGRPRRSSAPCHRRRRSRERRSGARRSVRSVCAPAASSTPSHPPCSRRRSTDRGESQPEPPRLGVDRAAHGARSDAHSPSGTSTAPIESGGSESTITPDRSRPPPCCSPIRGV